MTSVPEMQNPASSHQKMPVAWTIAGSDSGGGAGLQADLKVMNAFGVHGCSVVTALTAQNTSGVEASEPVSESMLRAQLDALQTDLQPAAIKTGMLGSAMSCRVLAEMLPPGVPLICDPVLKSTSGSNLLEPGAIELLVREILPRTTVLTPNLPEAEQLTGLRNAAAETMAARLLELGAGSVLIKGGHASGNCSRDYWTDGSETVWLSSPRLDTRHTHGTGCILASAIAASMAHGKTVREAVISAKTFLNQCLKSPAHLGSVHGPMQIVLFRDDPGDRPDISRP